MANKSCSVCKEIKSLDEFPKDNRAVDGRAANCKLCQSIKRKAWADKQEKKPKVSEVRAAAILAAGEKKCSKCGETKPLSEYHADKRNKDGLYGHCKSCHYSMTHAYETSERGREVVSKSKRKAYYERGGRERDRYKNARESARLKRAEYLKTEAGREAVKRKDKRRWLFHPEKIRAKSAVNKAVASGALPPVTTLICATPGCENQAMEYHHESYAEENFLRVIPLCKKHHAETYTNIHK